MTTATPTATTSLTPTHTVATRPAIALQVAAAASLLAGVIHYAVVPEHLTHWWVYAAFFTLLGAFEIVWAALILTGRERRLLLLGLIVNVAVLALWAVTRSTGLPFGPDPGNPEAVAMPDLLCCVAELVTVLALLYALIRPSTTSRTEDAASSRLPAQRA